MVARNHGFILKTSGDVATQARLVECFGGGRHDVAKPFSISSVPATPVIINC